MAVSDIIVGQQTYANNAITSADSFLSGLLSLAEQSTIAIDDLPQVTFKTNTADFDLAFLQPGSPTLDGVATPGNIQSVDAELPVFVPLTIEDLEAIPVSDFAGSPPVLDVPAVPSSTLPVAPTAPSITDPVLPTAPDVSLPDVPTITTVGIPEVPSIEIPLFEASEPLDNLVEPTTEFSFLEQEYNSALLDEVKAKLLSDLENGTYGLEPSDEDALWDRARDREMRAANAGVVRAMRFQAARGFPLPAGDLAIALRQAQEEVNQKWSDLNRDITLKRNDQYFEARKFAITQAKELEGILIGFHNSIMERALNAAKATLDAGIAIFDASVRAYNARLESYRTAAAVYEARIRANLTQVEIYRTEMEGKKLEVEVQGQRIDVYRAQIDGVNSVINLYKARLDAAVTLADVERLRIEAFRGLISSYEAQVRAKVAEFEMYKAQVDGQQSRAEIFKAEVDAYNATVNGQKVKADVEIEKLRARIARAANEIEVYKAQIDGFRAEVQKQVAQNNAILTKYGADVDSFQAASAAYAEGYRLETQSQALNDEFNNRNKEIAIENARLQFEALKLTLGTRLDASGHASNFYSALASGAVNSINALSTLSE